MKTALEYAEEFAAMQKKMVDYWGEATKKAAAGVTTDDTQKAFVDTLTKAGEQWQNMFASFSKGMGGAAAEKAGERFYKEWLSRQEEVTKEWQAATEKVQSAFGKPEYGQVVWNVMNDLMHTYLQRQEKSTMEAVEANPMFASLNGAAPASVKKAYKSVRDSLDSYTKIFDNWKPFTESVKGKKLSPEQVFEEAQKWFSPDQYKHVLDSLFSFMSPEHATKYQEQMQSMMKTFSTSWEKYSTSSTKNVQELANIMQQSMGGDYSGLTKWYSDAVKQSEAAMKPFAFMPPFYGNVPETATIAGEILKTIGEYNSEYARFRYHFYVTGQQATEKALKSVSEHISKGQMPSYDEFFKLWVKTNEETFTQLFKTKEYAALQGSLVEKGLSLRSGMQKMMEAGLKEYPIATRSELDEAYQKIQELTRTVRTLEREVKALRKEATSKTTTKKSPSATSAKSSAAKTAEKQETVEFPAEANTVA